MIHSIMSRFERDVESNFPTSFPMSPIYRRFTLGTTRSNSIMALGGRECAWLAILHGFGIRRAPRTYDRPNIPSIPREKHKLLLEDRSSSLLHFAPEFTRASSRQKGERERRWRRVRVILHLYVPSLFFFYLFISFFQFFHFCANHNPFYSLIVSLRIFNVLKLNCVIFLKIVTLHI